MTDNTSWFAKPDEYMPSAHGSGPRERTWEDRFRGALFGGAVGDALGAAVRYRTADEIQRWFGSHGVLDYLPVFGVRGAGTDLSQLTAFTLEALLRARASNPDGGGPLPPEIVATSHLRWLYTQGVPWQYAMSTRLSAHPEPGSWLLERPELFSTRDPAGMALRGLGKLATASPGAATEPPLGTTSLAEPIVWAAPAMVWSGSDEVVFAAGASIAGLLTRDGNATGASGLHCDVLGQLIRGAPLWDAVSTSDSERLGRAYRAVSSPADVRRAVHAAMFASHGARRPGPTELDTEFDTDGRPGELGIALTSVACTDGFADAVRMATNQSSDSCVTGALAGQLAGALYGSEAIPGHWLEELELGEIFATLCEDAVEAFAPPPLPKWAQRYVTDTKRAFSGPLELPSSASSEQDTAAWPARPGFPARESTVDEGEWRRPHSVVSERLHPGEDRAEQAVFASEVAESGDSGSVVAETSFRSGTTERAVEVSPVEETAVLPMMGLKRSSAASRVPSRTRSAVDVSERVRPAMPSQFDEAAGERSLAESADSPSADSPSSDSPPSADSAGVTAPASWGAGYSGSASPQLAGTQSTGTQSTGFELPHADSSYAESVSPKVPDPDADSADHLDAGSLAAEPETSVVEDIEEPFAPDAHPAESDPEVSPRVASGGGHAMLEDADSPAPSLTERVLGSFLGGGLGNALAAGLEVASSQQISATFGTDGPHGLGEFAGVHGAITDVTQLTLFTAEGLIRASASGRMLGVGDPLPELHLAYQRWLHTQGVSWDAAAGAFHAAYPTPDGWLIEVPGLFAARAPGHTTVHALAGFGQGGPVGSLAESVNDSKGCGAVVRAAPLALHSADPSEVFELAAAAAALTHGHPSGYLPAGALAVIVQQALLGRGLDDGVWLALQVLETWAEHEETTAMLKVAVELASHGVPTPQQLEQTLGDGWVGEQALAIAVCAALIGGQDVRLALQVAVHHSGDSAATGALCGDIVGALLGVAQLPVDWLADLELRDVVEQIALDCVAEFGVGEFLGDAAGVTAESAFGQPADEDWQERYPVRPWGAESDVDDARTQDNQYGEPSAHGHPSQLGASTTQRLPSLPGSRELAQSTALTTGGRAVAVSVHDTAAGEASSAVSEKIADSGQEAASGATEISAGQEGSASSVRQTWPYEESSGDGYSAAGDSWEASSHEGEEPVHGARGFDGEESGSEVRAPKPAPRRINGVVADRRSE